MEKPESFDIVGNLLCNYGLTGEDLAHEIFSYLDFSSIQDSRLVSKPWNLFLSNDRKLWLEMLRQTKPYIVFLSNQLSGESPNFADEMKNNWEEFFKCIEIRAKNDRFFCQKMIWIFKKIQLVHCAVQDVVHDCSDYKVFQKKFIGRKQAEEIQSEIDRSYSRRFDQSFLPCLQRKIGFLKLLQDDLKSQTPPNTPLYYYELRGEIQHCQIMLLRGIEKEFSTFLKSD